MKITNRSRICAWLLVLALVFSLMPNLAFATDSATYTAITTADELTTGQYVMAVPTGYAPSTYSSGWVLAETVTATEGVITNPSAATVWTITVGADGVKLTDSNGVTIAPKGGNSNGITTGDYTWAVSCSNGTFRFSGVGADTVILASNVGSENKFRGYKVSTVTGNINGYPCDFTLYKLSEGAVTPDPTDPDPTDPDPTDPDPTDPDPTDPEPTDPVETVYAEKLTALPVAGDKVIVYNSGMAMSATVSGAALAAVAAEVAENKLTVTEEMAQLEVTVNEEGQYIFTREGLYLTSGETGNALSFAAELTDCGKWTAEPAVEGAWYLKNVGANYKGDYNQAMEYYAGKGIFTTYGLKETEIYQMQLFLVPEEVVDPITDDMFEEGVYNLKDAAALTEGTVTVLGQVVYHYGNPYNDAASINSIILEDIIDGQIYGFQLYDYTNYASYIVGDVVKVTGTFSVYNGVPQIKPTEMTVVQAGLPAIPAQEITVSQMGADYLSEYVCIKDVTMGAYNGSGSTTITDATGSTALYKGAPLPEGATEADVTAVYACCSAYRTDYQLRNGTEADYVVDTTEPEPTDPEPTDPEPTDPEPTDPEPTCVTIAEALAGANGETFTVKGVITCLDGDNVYVQDATGGICVRMADGVDGLALGDTIIGTGSKSVYNGLPQLGSATYVMSQGMTLSAKTVTIDGLTIADICTYVQLKGVEVTEIYDNDGAYTNPNVTVTDGVNTIQIYKAVVAKNEDGSWVIAVGDKIDVKAAVSYYDRNNAGNGKFQLRNTVAEEITPARSNGLITDLSNLLDGDTVVIFNPANGKTLSTEYSGYYNSAADVTMTEGKLSGYTGVDLWTVQVNDDGTYSFLTADGGKLSMDTSRTSTPLDKVNDTWTVTPAATADCFYITNVGRAGYKMEYYAQYGTWSAYNGTADEALFAQQFYLVTNMDVGGGELPQAGEQVVLYNLSAQAVLAEMSGNVEDPSSCVINAATATLGEDGSLTVGNGGAVFTIEVNGEYYRFYNETYGYLASTGTGSNAFYLAEASEDADWKLSTGKSGGFFLESRTAKYQNQYSQYLECYAGIFKTYSMYNVTDYNIYEFLFLPCTDNTIDGVVNDPQVIFAETAGAFIGKEFSIDFTIDAPFGVNQETLTCNYPFTYNQELDAYTVTVPVEQVVGENLTITVTGKDNKEVAFQGEAVIAVTDEPLVDAVTPAPNAQTMDDKRPVISAVIINAGENPTVTMTVNEADVTATYENGVITYTPAEDMADGRYTVCVTVTRADGKTNAKTWSFYVGKASFQLFFGQLHSHTQYSDGAGTLESALDYILNLPESANVDFVAFTDHSNYFDSTDAANPEGALYDTTLATADSQKLWNAYLTSMREFNASQDKVLAIPGFEMTWSGGPGHINTFVTPGIVSRNNKTLNNKTNDAGMKAYYALLSQAEGAESISQFNHPGSTFGTFTDFSYWDAIIDNRMYLVEVGNGEGQVGAGGYYPSYEYYTMALDKGWHVSPTNNQDNHKGKWGNANDARDVILAETLTEESIYEAIRAYRVYSTEDKNLEIQYTVNEQMMGSIIEEIPETLNLAVSVYDPDATDSISKVEVIVNSGKVAYTWEDPVVLAAGELTCTLDPTYSYYYIRVTQGDGELAVTSPVWVGETLKLGISSVVSGTSTPVTNEEVTLTTTLFNSEVTDATVKSLTFTVNGSEVVGVLKGENDGGYTIPANSTLTVDFGYTPTVAKITKVTVNAIVELEGVEYEFSMEITLDVLNADSLVYIGIDASHYNEYVAGNYKDSMGNFGQLAAGYSVRTVELKTGEELLEACSNENGKFKAIILTAPSRRLSAAQSELRVYTDDEIAALKAYNEAGGAVIMAGWSDWYENYPDVFGENNVNLPAEKHMAATQNSVLEALGSSLRISDDATHDDSYNGGQTQRLYFNTYGENFLTEGVEVDPENPHDRMYTEVFSHYGGASIYVVDENGEPTSTMASGVSPVVYGHSSTYTKDSDGDGLGGDAIPMYAVGEDDERLLIMAMEEQENKGLIIVSGAAFMSNFEVQATIEDSGAEKNYSNYKICENLVQFINPIVVTDIAEVQAQTEAGFKYTIEGVVTSNASGYDKDTAFFDCIYVQDETAGINCFPVAGNYKIGDVVRVTGATEFYQGEVELQVTDIQVIGSADPVVPTVITGEDFNSGKYIGSLVTVSGVVEKVVNNGLIESIYVKTEDGETVRVFIDGYITTETEVEDCVEGCLIEATGIVSYDNTYAIEHDSYVRLRVRDRADVVCTENPEPPVPMDYSDVSEDDWYYEHVKKVHDEGIMIGLGDGSFGANSKLTRGQMVVILYRLEGAPEVEFNGVFKDVKETDYYAQAVSWAVANGITNGVSADSFAPNAAITRQQMVTFLYRLAQFRGEDTTADANVLEQFDDASAIQAYAIPAMAWAVQNGIINGLGDGTVRPAATATRAQVAKVIAMIL